MECHDVVIAGMGEEVEVVCIGYSKPCIKPTTFLESKLFETGLVLAVINQAERLLSQGPNGTPPSASPMQRDQGRL